MKHDDAPVMMWTARPDLACEAVSASWLDFTGMTHEEALAGGFEVGWTRVVHPEDLARWLDTYVRAFDAREPVEIEYRLRRHDGEYHWVLERGHPRFAPGGLFLGYTGACLDIDERRRAHERRGGFIASVLQQMEPVARAMAASAAQLRAGLPSDSDAARAAEAIEANARTQERIVARLLVFSTAQCPQSPSDEPLLAGVRVLLVEDDPQLRDTLLKVLSVAGAETRVATSAQAPDALCAWRPDVLLSEDGGCLRAAALTGAGSSANPMAAGYDAELAKPIEPVALLATVARLAQPVHV
jgi:PAS domain S-box-containing protein